MRYLNRFLHVISLLLVMNIIFLWNSLPNSLLIRILVSVIVFIAFILEETIPVKKNGFTLRLRVLYSGYDHIMSTLWAIIAEFIIYVFFRNIFTQNYISNLVVSLIILIIHYLIGFWKTAFCSNQIGIKLRIAMFIFWWVIPINLFLISRWLKIVRGEIYTAKSKYLLDTTRIENEICKTKYPIVMVHGIFFRDFHYLNYWGRIPAALKKNGAVVYYGKQQSSLPVAKSAEELKNQILNVLKETGAEKVNIVAHSKGGLDSRYAISKLQLAPYVASLTTVNTPHRGVKFADVLLEKLPKTFVDYVTKRYNEIFKLLGDSEPDFMGGVNDLRASVCEKFNEEVLDVPEVYYQSVMSKMKNCFSAGFPLNMAYLIAKKHDGENDGLVGVDSAPWGNYLGLLSTNKKGISHGDMIDLSHIDLPDFDVSEFYVTLISNLKKMGY